MKMGPKARQFQTKSALAGDRDILVAMAMGALCAGFGDGAGNFVGIDPAIGRGVGKVPGLAVGAGGMGPASVALGQALVDPIAVRLVGDDEDAGLGRRARSGDDEATAQKCRKGSHDAPWDEGTAIT